ncbi:MAG: hypothetical protein ACSHX6_00500 [Akkermansiaceae bacterium]
MKKTIIAALVATSSITPTFAQKPPSTPGSGAGGGNSGGGDTVIRRENEPQASAHGQEIPMVDPTNKTIDFQGKKYSLMDNNLGGQFEAYLATDTLSSQAAVEYRATLRQILDYLAPNKTDGSQLKQAYDLLSVAAEYPGDGNLCESLANAIYSAQLTKNHIGSKKEYIAKLLKEQKTLIHNMGVIESKLDVQPAGQDRGRGGDRGKGKGGDRNRGGTTSIAGQSIEYTMMQKRLVEITALIKKTEVEGTIDLTQSKVQYQAMMVQLFIQRRFEHVIIAARFYNLIYKDGDTKMRLQKNSDTEKFFSEGIGVNPTVAGLDAAANEAIRKVDTLVSAFDNNISSGRIHAASERLVEAFAIGEFLPAVQIIAYEDKAKIQQYVQDANDMVKTLEANDLERGEELNQTLQDQASDYNASEAKSYIAAKKTESKSYARDAKIALYQMKKARDTQERYNEEQRFKTAMFKSTFAWPSNPDLEDINNLLDKIIDSGVESEDMLLVARQDFDRYVETKSWAAIMKEENLSRFIAAFNLSKSSEDLARKNQLQQITREKSSVVAALKEAETLHDRGFAEAAWEIIDIRQKEHPNDLELSQAKARYSGEAAKFANLIAKAQGYEDSSPTSAQALTWYLKAENIHPDSKYASAGIKRIISAKFDADEDEINQKETIPASNADSESDSNSSSDSNLNEADF